MADERKTVLSGHFHVGDQDVEGFSSEGFECQLAVGDEFDLVASRGEVFSQEF